MECRTMDLREIAKPGDIMAWQLIDWIDRAEYVRDRDETYWEELGTGQDTEESETSGFLAGQIAGLRAAFHIIHGQYALAEDELDLRLRT